MSIIMVGHLCDHGKARRTCWMCKRDADRKARPDVYRCKVCGKEIGESRALRCRACEARRRILGLKVLAIDR